MQEGIRMLKETADCLASERTVQATL